MTSYALDFVSKIGYENSTNFAHIFSNYVNLLFELGEYDLAEEQLSLVDNKSLHVSPQIELRIHLTNAYTYSKLEKYETAIHHFEKAYSIIEDSEKSELIDLKISYYTHKIDFHILYEDLAL